MSNFRKTKSISILSFTTLFLSLFILTGCAPHPATGTWISSAENEASFNKVIVHFEAKLEIYSKNSDKPVLYCGWSAASTPNINIACMRSENQKIMDIYQFNVTGENTAELMQKEKVIASFTQG